MIIERDIFNRLLEFAADAIDPNGLVAAGLAQNGELKLMSVSAEDGLRHAEDLVLEQANNMGLAIDEETVLLVTLEPCSERSPERNLSDCATMIINSNIKKVIYAAQDPQFSPDTKKRFLEAGIDYIQIDDPQIIEDSRNLFNSTLINKTNSEGKSRIK
jgi:pyrimidine deaminase RibD-like protein